MTHFWEQFSSNEIVMVKLWEKTLDVIDNRLFKHDVIPPDISVLCQMTLNLDIKELPKEGHLLCAIWVYYLLKLRKSHPLTSMKYPTYQQFLQTYCDENDPILKATTDSEERHRLWSTANWMAELFKIIPANKNKGLAILIIPKVVEGWEAKYVTGSGQKEVTIHRVKIFETEGNIKPLVRGKFKPKKVALKKRKDTRTYHKTYKTSILGITAVKPALMSLSIKKQQSTSIPPTTSISRYRRNNTPTTISHPIKRRSTTFESSASGSSSSGSGKSNASTVGNMSVESNATINSTSTTTATHLTRSSSRKPVVVTNQEQQQQLLPPSLTTTSTAAKRPYQKHKKVTTTTSNNNNANNILPSSQAFTTSTTTTAKPTHPHPHTHHHRHLAANANAGTTGNVWDMLLSDDAHSHHECFTDDEDISVSMADGGGVEDHHSNASNVVDGVVNSINNRSIRKNSRDFCSHFHTTDNQKNRSKIHLRPLYEVKHEGGNNIYNSHTVDYEEDENEDEDICSIVSLTATDIDTTHLLLPMEDFHGNSSSSSSNHTDKVQEKNDNNAMNINTSSDSSSSGNNNNHLMLPPLSQAPNNNNNNNNNNSNNNLQQIITSSNAENVPTSTVPINSSDDDFIEMLSLLRDRSTSNNNSNNNADTNSPSTYADKDSAAAAIMKAPLLSRSSSSSNYSYDGCFG